MERARARVVKVRESRERERRDIPSSMATQETGEAGETHRKRVGGEGEAKRGGQTTRGNRTNGTEGIRVVTDGAGRAEQMLWGGFKG